MANVDFKTAHLILEKAFQEAEQVNDAMAELITSALNHRHKTYKYVLVTALLAKSANEAVYMLSMQKGGSTPAHYDARSLCHKVIVPFEKLSMPGCLENSNEPFCNKPARYVELSKDNAVRSGSDKELLCKLVDSLPTIATSEEAYKYLKHACWVMKQRHENYLKKFSLGDTLIDVSEFSQLVLDYVYKLTDHTLEGEVCPLIVAELEKLYLGEGYRVVPHKVNESGSSSKEVGDIDVFDANGELVNAIEVKDKDFGEQDVVHAINKFRAAHLLNSMFIYGKNVNFDEDAVFNALKRIGHEGHYCCLISILNYAKLRIYELRNVTLRDFVDGLLRFSKAINAKDDTIIAIKEIASQIF